MSVERQISGLMIAVLCAACAASTGRDDGSADVSRDVSRDVSADAADTWIERPDSSLDVTCSGFPPGDACVSGTPGGACGDAGLMRICRGGAWVCPAGTIPISQCGCVGRPPGTCVCTSGGWRCPDAGDVIAPPDAGCANCIGATLSWGWNGGFVAYEETSSIAPCRTFSFARRSFGGPSDRTCSNEMPACTATDTPNIGDVQSALADPDVVRAFAAAPILYGIDARPIDGSVFRIESGGRRIEIGDDCAPGSMGCRPVPAGVARLRSFLEGVTRERLRFGSCPSVFPDAGR